MDKIKPYIKALVAFVTPGAVLIGAAVTEASEGGSTITTSEWVTALVACLVTSGAVYRIPNKDPKGEHQDESVQPAEPEVLDESDVLLDQPGVDETPRWDDSLTREREQ